MKYLPTRSDLLPAFDLNPAKYSKIKPMQEPLIGVSVVLPHYYDLISRLKLKGDYVCLIRIFLDPKWEETEGNIKKIIAMASLALSSDTDSYPIPDLAKIGSYKPIDLEFKNEYYLDIRSKKFRKFDNDVDLDFIISEIFTKHLKTTHYWKGMFARFKIELWIFLSEITLLFARLIAAIFYLLFGEKVAYDFFSEYSLKNLKNKEIKLVRSKPIKIFEYEASIHLIFSFCLLHLTAYLFVVALGWKLPLLLTNIFKNNFLTIIYSIVILYLIEVVIHPLLRIFFLWLLAKARKMNERVSQLEINI